ncbi:MAG TPA: flagellar assembly protein FliW [Solirubrobacteraceae bacterium]|jgi:flagellar assembly factor FliW|nr:flagellar assembly protein FliW [Solirubrobacteraceae bacterium]
MSLLTIDSSRFGALQVPDDAAIEFPLGLIGLGGLRYTLIERNPGSGFLWLHSLEDPALALPVLDPRRCFADFALVLADEDRVRIGAPDLSLAAIYVTVRTAPDPADTLVNLRAPLVVWERRGHQVLNTAPGAQLRVPLFGGLAGGRDAAAGPPAADA